jgi:hypothetical protein
MIGTINYPRRTIDQLINSRELPRYTRVDELLRASWERTDARLAAKRREHARKASRAAIRRPMTRL